MLNVIYGGFKIRNEKISMRINEKEKLIKEI